MAAVAGIELTTEEMKQKSSDITSTNGRIASILEDTSTDINETESVWQDASAEALRGQYRSLKQTYDDFSASIASHAKFVNDAAVAWEAVEQANKASNETATSTYNDAA